MRYFHLFNPGHEAAVCNGSPTYMPPAAVACMQRDLAFLPAWYGTPGDFVWVGEAVPDDFLEPLNERFGPLPQPLTRSRILERGAALPPAEAAPWGQSPQSRYRFERLRNESGWSLAVPDYDEAYARLCSRQTAAVCLRSLQATVQGFDRNLFPRFRCSPDEIDSILAADPHPYLIKAPYSCAGRGLRKVAGRLNAPDREWIGGVIRRQGCIGIERLLDKRFDLALEFYSDGNGRIRYEGLSLFHTGNQGNYTGSFLGTPEEAERWIIGEAGADWQELLEAVRENWLDLLQETAAYTYRGYLGVDMLAYREETNGTIRLHPCVEINWRRTMGQLALAWSRRYLAPASHGILSVEAFPEPGLALRLHRERIRMFPLRTDNDRLTGGYLSLCPVSEETRYLASVRADVSVAPAR